MTRSDDSLHSPPPPSDAGALPGSPSHTTIPAAIAAATSATPDAATPPARPPLLRYKATITYDGTLFHGWQKQEPPGLTPLRTVAGVVESALTLTLAQRINLVGASRTDAGVHARGQVAQFDAACRIPIERLAQAINSRLPHDVEILHVEVTSSGFDAISQPVSKQYRYRIFNSPHRPLEKRNYVYHCWYELDVAKMQQAADLLVGTHDFEGFAAAGHNRTTTIRTIHACRIERVDDGSGPEVQLVVQGDGFLYNMVRIIAGTLLEVGRGHLPPQVTELVIATCDRRQAGPTLPPGGLWLEWIKY